MITDDQIRAYVAYHGTADDRRRVANAWLGRPAWSQADRDRITAAIEEMKRRT